MKLKLISLAFLLSLSLAHAGLNPRIKPSKPEVPPQVVTFGETRIYQNFQIPIVKLTGGKRFYATTEIHGTSAEEQALNTQYEVWQNGTRLQTVKAFVSRGTVKALIPGDNIYPGVQLLLRVNPKSKYQYTKVIELDVNPEVRFSLRIVPILSSDGELASVPSESEIREVLEKLPVPDNSSIRFVEPLRVPYEMKSASDWVGALNSLMFYRINTLGYLSDEKYYAFVNWNGSSILGISYMPSGQALGISPGDFGTEWKRVMLHELGHALSLPHAPCGSVAGPDDNYPYPEGSYGMNFPFDIIKESFVSIPNADVMGYCAGEYFSDYNYRKLQVFLEANHSSNKKSSMYIKKEYGSWWKLEQGKLLFVSDHVARQPGGTMVELFHMNELVKAYLHKVDHAEVEFAWIPHNKKEKPID